jgi:hypothetical protein
MPELWEGARRLPYFFSCEQPEREGRRAVMCPQCSLEHLEKEPEMLRAHYSVNRSVMCRRCGILIGPMNDEEMVEYE